MYPSTKDRDAVFGRVNLGEILFPGSQSRMRLLSYTALRLC